MATKSNGSSTAAVKPVAERPVTPKAPAQADSGLVPSGSKNLSGIPNPYYKSKTPALTKAKTNWDGPVPSTAKAKVTKRRSVSGTPLTPVSGGTVAPVTPVRRKASAPKPGAIETPRPVKPRTSKASTDPWKTGW